MSNTSASQLLDDFPLDLLGQQERINRLYTPITFCFPLPDETESTRAEIIETLEDGLSRLARAFPWTAGEVVACESGKFKIRARSSPWTVPPLVIKDFSGDNNDDDDNNVASVLPSWDELQQAGFPFSMLDEDVIAPCKTMVEDDDGAVERPVLRLQANFIRGGLLLTVCGQHGAMDVAGQAQVIALLAKAMRGEVFSRQEIQDGNMIRRGHIPLPEEKEEEDEYTTGPDTGGETQQTPPLTWAYIAFEKSELLERVKRPALKETTWTTFVSKDDALTAFFWQAISRAREPRLQRQHQQQQEEGGATTTTTLTRNVDVRKHFGLPPTYPGLFVTFTSHTAPISELVHSRSLSSVALELRAALDTESLRQNLRDQAASIVQDPEAAARKATAQRARPDLDVRLSSWAKERLYEVDFGVFLGKPGAVRRPRFERGAREGLVYFMPRGMDGEMVVGVCLREEDMERLKGSARIASFARWID
ncbi:hypothetical protein M406DRAFT_45677 [Cryphonectria parasitica EP155]|uniref:Trichothecene 3-O-acetyltransferase-like N-terminal domain-containing protein n=1 Tax=Cryphonectria parasitica (strain ATCC 38755 / EP155) TaxID=660469 RepID=A0A9P4XWM6_CRYP1|nr:uncharacterized protein M406DRAFT_45677 [Cryphonectria parasitica EP155]KAF3762263.1 hypothetical protein M406DRAFT_45677 [Cryphonectria parasitica EP155]